MVSDGKSVIISSNGTSWTRYVIPFSSNGYIKSICWSPEQGIFCGAGVSFYSTYECIVYSPDGINWTPVSVDEEYDYVSFYSIAWSPSLGLFCAVGYHSYSGRRIIISPDGINWTFVLSTFEGTGDSYLFNSVTWIEELGLFCAVGDATVYSNDGINWVRINDYDNGVVWNGITWSNTLSKLVSVGTTNVIDTVGITTGIEGGFSILRSYNYDNLQSITPLSSSSINNRLINDIVTDKTGNKLYCLAIESNSLSSEILEIDPTTLNILNTYPTGYNAEYITIDIDQSVWTIGHNGDKDGDLYAYKVLSSGSLESYDINTSFGRTSYHFGGIAGDTYGGIWFLDSSNDKVVIGDKDDLTSNQVLNISIDSTTGSNKYVAFGDWNGFRWQNKFANTSAEAIVTYTLSGESAPFKIYDSGTYNLQKINEDFDMTETLKTYATTENMQQYMNLFDEFFRSIYGDKYDNGTFYGRNVYEKISNFVLNHSDIDHCNVSALESYCQLCGIDFEQSFVYPIDIKLLLDLFSIKFKLLWGDDYDESDFINLKGDKIDTSSYVLSSDPTVNIIAIEKFNNYPTLITPLLPEDGLILSSYASSWGWGLSVPDGESVDEYYDFYTVNITDPLRTTSIIDWENELTDLSLKPISSYSDYMSENGILSVILGDKLRNGLDLYL